MSFFDAAKLIVNYAPCLSNEAGLHLLRALLSGEREFCHACLWFYSPASDSPASSSCLCSQTK